MWTLRPEILWSITKMRQIRQYTVTCLPNLRIYFSSLTPFLSYSHFPDVLSPFPLFCATLHCYSHSFSSFSQSLSSIPALPVPKPIGPKRVWILWVVSAQIMENKPFHLQICTFVGSELLVCCAAITAELVRWQKSQRKHEQLSPATVQALLSTYVNWYFSLPEAIPDSGKLGWWQFRYGRDITVPCKVPSVNLQL